MAGMREQGVLCRWEELPDFMRTKEVFPYYQNLRRHLFQLLLKRIFDFWISTVLMVWLIPIFAAVAIWVKLDSKGPVFYQQERVTQYGKIFRIYKFRTMIQNADEMGGLVTIGGDPRITQAGKWLRKYRLDELPQLFNIWKGEMSFVGTRPEVVKYVKQYTKEMYATLLMPAGVTSRASIEFKDESRMMEEGMTGNVSPDWIYVKRILPKKMKYNLDGIRNFGILSDLYLMFLTVVRVLHIE